MEIKPKENIKFPKYVKIPEGIEGYENKMEYVEAHKDDEYTDAELAAYWKNKHLEFIKRAFELIELMCVDRILNDVHPEKVERTNEETLALLNGTVLPDLEDSLRTIFSNFSFDTSYEGWFQDWKEYADNKRYKHWHTNV